jgi:hypothetical protein
VGLWVTEVPCVKSGRNPKIVIVDTGFYHSIYCLVDGVVL